MITAMPGNDIETSDVLPSTTRVMNSKLAGLPSKSHSSTISHPCVDRMMLFTLSDELFDIFIAFKWLGSLYIPSTTP